MGNGTFILGAGATGLAAGYASGISVVEAAESPGGICSTYYVSQDGTRSPSRSKDEDDYRFEPGGGHWLWGMDDRIANILGAFSNLKSYQRDSGVWFPGSATIVPFPIQYHLSRIPEGIGVIALQELLSSKHSVTGTAREQFYETFGPTLCKYFFEPFHKLYTAGLWNHIAPQDEYKSPVDKNQVLRGFRGENVNGGYNVTFHYPAEGLGEMFRRISERCNVMYDRRVARIDVESQELYFSDGKIVPYDRLVSSLPLNTMASLTGLKVNSGADPYTSVLVLNIGGSKGTHCPREHWLYVPHSDAGFHRVGFYSNVDMHFLPRRARNGRGVSLYVEKAFLGGERPGVSDLKSLCRQIIEELKSWNFVDDVQVADATWIDVAYTWSYPGSSWKEDMLQALRDRSIFQIGRYGRWQSVGIIDSVREGLDVGASMRQNS